MNLKKRNTVTATNKVDIIGDQLIVLHSQLKQIILDAQTSNIYHKIARNFYRKCEQANKWFNNPYFDSILGNIF